MLHSFISRQPLLARVFRMFLTEQCHVVGIMGHDGVRSCQSCSVQAVCREVAPDVLATSVAHARQLPNMSPFALAQNPLDARHIGTAAIADSDFVLSNNPAISGIRETNLKSVAIGPVHEPYY